MVVSSRFGIDRAPRRGYPARHEFPDSMSPPPKNPISRALLGGEERSASPLFASPSILHRQRSAITRSLFRGLWTHYLWTRRTSSAGREIEEKENRGCGGVIGMEEEGREGWERATRKGPSTMDRLGDSETSGPRGF